MKKFSVLAACGIGAALTVSAGSAQAAPVTTSGNLQHTAVQYWCDKGIPNFVVAVRAVKTTERTVTASATGFAPSTVGPVTSSRAAYFFATKNMAGKTLTLKVVGNTSGSSFSTTAMIPATCAGLPSLMPGKSAAATTPKPATSTQPAAPAAGPKVQTDYVAPSNDNFADALTFGAFGLAAAGSVAYARRSSRR